MELLEIKILYLMKCEEMYLCLVVNSVRQTVMYGLCTVTSYKVSSELFAQTHSTMMKHLPSRKVMAVYHSYAVTMHVKHSSLVLCISSKHEKLFIVH